jgi:alcohol dehydrogenase class IV
VVESRPAVGWDFTWEDGERVVRFGPGALADAPELLRERGFDGYALLTTERALAAASALAEGAAAVVRVPPGQIPEVAAAIRAEAGRRPLVALGGGRVVDSAKAIAAVERVPCAAVPTTLSGAEMTRIHRLPAGTGDAPLVRPALVVADPALMASQPMPALAASAMNALGHAVEALYVPRRNPVCDIAALHAAQLLSQALDSPEPEREPLALGALLAAYALGGTGYAVHHVVCQTIVRVAGAPHAETNAVMLPHSVRLMARRAPDAIGRLAGALGPQDDDPALAVVRVGVLAARAGPTRLAEVGVRPDHVEPVVAAALARPQLGATPDPPGADELRALVEGAL